MHTITVVSFIMLKIMWCTLQYTYVPYWELHTATGVVASTTPQPHHKERGHLPQLKNVGHGAAHKQSPYDKNNNALSTLTKQDTSKVNSQQSRSWAPANHIEDKHLYAATYISQLVVNGTSICHISYNSKIHSSTGFSSFFLVMYMAENQTCH